MIVSKQNEDKLETLETDDSGDGKIVVENGFSFLLKLRTEAQRQKDLRRAKLTYACTPIEEVPVSVNEQQLNQLAESFDVFEEDDD